MTQTIMTFLQQQGKSRRRIVSHLQDWNIRQNNEVIFYRNTPLSEGDTISIIWWESYHIHKEHSARKQEGTIILYNKPMGYVVSKNDTHNMSIYDILPDGWKDRYVYIGRLDKDSHGLLVLTDIPALVSFFAHPRYEHKKNYIVTIRWQLTPHNVHQGTVWVVYNDSDTGKAETLARDSCTHIRENIYAITLSSWKKRHIRRLCDMLGHDVLDLQRMSFGPRVLPKDLPLGKRKIIPLDSTTIENLVKNWNSYTQMQI